jgi:soluble lytic murein transglycosylase
MHKNVFALSLLGVSAASLAAGAGYHGKISPPALPAAVQAVAFPQAEPPAPQQAAPSPVPSGIASEIARWTSLRQTDGLPFSSYASFLVSHRGWPGETAMRRTAERAISDSISSGDVISFFRAFPPLTPAGHAKHAFALLNSGRPDEARSAARTAWQAGVLPRADEDRLLSLFGGALTQVDHDLRIETLLANKDTTSAQRALALASPAQRPLYEARLALQTRSGDAASRLANLGSVDGNAGLLMDRANWLRASGQSQAARQLLAQPRSLSTRPANPVTWFETMLDLARGAAADGQWTTAYQIASQIDDAYAPGTDVSARPYGERDAYTSLAWLAGSAALHRLGRAADAARMFERYGRAARSPQTRAKGFYWAARAAAAGGQAQQGNSLLEQAAGSADQFYGQLALERLGRRVETPPQVPQPLSEAERQAFASRSIVQATRALGLMGRYSDQSIFVRALADQLKDDRERALAADFGRTIGRPDLGVWVARAARSEGINFYNRAAFPEVTIPSAWSHRWSISHAIMRQESSFDRTAVSHAGARGMMQLMPGTAREVSGKLGMGYDFGRLTSDPSYNITLGTAYFGTLLDQWGGNVPLAVASYNAGAGNVRKWVRANGDPRLPGTDILRWIEEIPFSETRNYVQRVLENAVVYDTLAAQRGQGGTANRLSFYLGKAGPG